MGALCALGVGDRKHICHSQSPPLVAVIWGLEQTGDQTLGDSLDSACSVHAACLGLRIYSESIGWSCAPVGLAVWLAWYLQDISGFIISLSL